jgi:hypothetical protein
MMIFLCTSLSCWVGIKITHLEKVEMHLKTKDFKRQEQNTDLQGFHIPIKACVVIGIDTIRI